MKISSIPQAYRNVNRTTEILSVLSKYGLADWISRLNLDFAKGIFKNHDGSAIADLTRAQRIRMALAELGPTFIKLGQLLSTRPELIGPALADELTKLQTSAPADSGEIARKTIEEELGQSIDQLFLTFHDQAIAAASIGQVHRAVLRDGSCVVVKVKRAGIDSVVRNDVDIMGWLADLAERIPEFAAYRPSATMAEFRRTLLRELDFGREERNLQQFEARFKNNPHVRIPHPYADFCTPRVLTMEQLSGYSLDSFEKLATSGLDLDSIARYGAELYLEMIFTDGYYHADPHPGNIVLMPGNVIGLMDFGMVGRIDEPLREDVEELMYAIVNGDAEHLTTVIGRIGRMPGGLDQMAFRSDVADFVTHYGRQSVKRLDVGRVLREMTEMIYRYQIVLPAQLSMLIKALVTLEGTAKILSPSFSIIEVMVPFQRRALRRRLSPTRRLKKMRRVYLEMEHLFTAMPQQIYQIIRQIQSGEFDVHLDHRGLEPSVNRLVLGMLASALFLGSSLMLSMKVPPVLFQSPTWLGMHQISILGLSGCCLSFLVGLRLLGAIGKSGHLDRRK